jgi:hypothetical protein
MMDPEKVIDPGSGSGMTQKGIMSQDELEKIQTELEKEEERKKKPAMPVSGRSVFEIQRIIKNRPPKISSTDHGTDEPSHTQ